MQVVLNEECGLIEWVPHCVAFRNIMTSLHTDFEANAPLMRELYPDGNGAAVAKLSLPQQVLTEKLSKHINTHTPAHKRTMFK